MKDIWVGPIRTQVNEDVFIKITWIIRSNPTCGGCFKCKQGRLSVVNNENDTVTFKIIGFDNNIMSQETRQVRQVCPNYVPLVGYNAVSGTALLRFKSKGSYYVTICTYDLNKLINAIEARENVTVTSTDRKYSLRMEMSNCGTVYLLKCYDSNWLIAKEIFIVDKSMITLKIKDELVELTQEQFDYLNRQIPGIYTCSRISFKAGCYDPCISVRFNSATGHNLFYSIEPGNCVKTVFKNDLSELIIQKGEEHISKCVDTILKALRFYDPRVIRGVSVSGILDNYGVCYSCDDFIEICNELRNKYNYTIDSGVVQW